MDRKVLFAGDGNIDLQFAGLAAPPQIDREVLCTEYGAAVGGSSSICAAAYSYLGGRAEYCGLFGDDENGRLMERMLRNARVGLELLSFTSEHATGVTVNLVHESTRTQITYPGTLSVVDESETIARELGRFVHLHLAGLYPLTRFLPHVASLLSAARAAGVTTSVTTQWDPKQEWRYLPEWLPHLSYLFVNKEEALSITGRPNVEDAWKALADSTECPLVTLGASGAFARGRKVAGVPVSVRDTTGAGDTFAAGFLFGVIEKQMAFDAAVRYGCGAGALSCTYFGGVSPELSDEKVMKLIS
jgi:ribokinase